MLLQAEEHQDCQHTIRSWGGGWEQILPDRCRRNRPLSTPWSWTCSFQDWERINLCCVNHLVCGVLLRQPSQTNITPNFSSAVFLTLSASTRQFLYPSYRPNGNWERAKLLLCRQPCLSNNSVHRTFSLSLWNFNLFKNFQIIKDHSRITDLEPIRHLGNDISANCSHRLTADVPDLLAWLWTHGICSPVWHVQTDFIKIKTLVIIIQFGWIHDYIHNAKRLVEVIVTHETRIGNLRRLN